MATSRHRLFLLLVFALLIRLAAGWAWQSQLDGRFGMGDSESYWVLGQNIAEGKPYQYGSEHARVFRTPGYPLLLAPILWLVGDNQAAVFLARAEAAFLGVLAVVGVWWLTRLLFDDGAALVAAALATFYPGAIALSALILSEAPFCPLMLLQLGLWTIAYRSRSIGQATFFSFCGGLTAGAATLIRPSWLLFTPLAAVMEIALGFMPTKRLAAAGTAARQGAKADVPSAAKQQCGIRFPALDPRHEQTFSRHLAITFCMILGLVVAMFPWWIRNAAVTGRFVPTTLQVGASLYDGLNPEATGASDMDFVAGFISQEHDDTADRSRPEAVVPHDSFEVCLDRRMRSEAIAWAWANPGRAVELAGIKFLRVWNLWPNEPRLSGWPVRFVVLFTYTPLLFFAIIGAWRTRNRGWPYILCWLPAVYFTLLHMVFVSSIRYRIPAMLALLVLASAGIMDWGSGIRKRKPLAASQELIPHP